MSQVMFAGAVAGWVADCGDRVHKMAVEATSASLTGRRSYRLILTYDLSFPKRPEVGVAWPLVGNLSPFTVTAVKQFKSKSPQKRITVVNSDSMVGRTHNSRTTITNTTSCSTTSTEPSCPRNAGHQSIKHLSALIFVSILGLWSTACQPVEFSQPPPFLLNLHLVARQFLLPDHWDPIFATLRTTARGSGVGRYGRGLHPGAYGGVHSTAFLATERLLDHGLLALVYHPPGFNVPNFRTLVAWDESKVQQSDGLEEHT
jgi:hypothetical protein